MQIETLDTNASILQESLYSYQKGQEILADQSPTFNNHTIINGKQYEDIFSSMRRKIYNQIQNGVSVPNRRSRSVRKLTQKALKTMKIKVSTFSKEIHETKLTVKDWFKKKIEDNDDKERIILKCRDWLQKCITMLDYKQFFDIAQKYIKSEELDFNVNQLKKNPQIQDFAEIPYSTVLQAIPPGGLQSNTPPSLVLIRLKIPLTYLTKKDNSFMTERLYWDLEDQQSEAQMFQNLTIILMDLFNETHSHELKNLLYQEFMVILQICYLQLIVQLQNHQKIQTCWKVLFESGFDIHEEAILLDGTIPIRLHLRNHFKEDIQWDTSYNLKYIDEFSLNLINEQGLDKKFAILIASQISTQIQNFIENKLNKLQTIFSSLIDQEELKGSHLIDPKLKFNISFRDNLDLQMHSEVKQHKLPQNQELQMFLKKNVEFLPNDISKHFVPQNKNEKLEICIDFDDIRHNENQFNLQLTCNDYMDGSIYRELMKGSLSKTLLLK